MSIEKTFGLTVTTALLQGCTAPASIFFRRIKRRQYKRPTC